ncbi:hypothetical protein FQN54_007271 [Arachnomyces sp. PD_36]|nr:hypothetical protein FQN54_007271 [Arachnomyces sp. PD_36]
MGEHKDAIPKKRGPKTDVLEALLKRVDGLEKRLQEEKKPISPSEDRPPVKKNDEEMAGTGDSNSSISPTQPSSMDPTSHSVEQAQAGPSSIASSSSRREDMQHARSTPDRYSDPSLSMQQPPLSALPPAPVHNALLPDLLLDTYFNRIHGKPFYILDEPNIRHRHQLGQLPPFLSMAIYALTWRYAALSGNPDVSSQLGYEYGIKARRAVDIDDPTIDGLQTLLLLSLAFFANGQGKKAYMTLSNCVGMVVALDLYREAPGSASPSSKRSSPDREMKRRLFWACYMMDRFTCCGSKRPSLISDSSISLRLPSWLPNASSLPVDGEIFNAGPNIQYSSDSRRKGQGAASLLIDITRILGITNHYLAAGGVKGDSHFPWHSLSNLSKIRQELDIWAAGTRDMFASIDTLFGHPESTTLLLSKLIYHLVHCLIYRPFLPIDLVELRGTGQHQSWQIEATNLCFSHSNAIAELVELGKSSSLVEWPSFVGYCVATAGTVHIHGVHYKGREGEVFSSSAEFLTREMHQLSWLRNFWAGVQHLRELLQNIYNCHSELVRTLATSPMRFSPVFHLEDFFDRYPGQTFDGSNVRLLDLPPEIILDSDPMHPQDASHKSIYSNRSMAAPPLPAQQRSLQPIHQQQSQRHPQQAAYASPTSSSQQQPVHHHSGTHRVSNTSEPAPVSPTVNFGLPPEPTPQQQQQDHQQPQQHIQHQNFSPTTTDIPSFPPLPDGTGGNNPFSPSAFPFSPSAFPPDALFNIAPTPPSNPQYATFPFDLIRQQHMNASQPGAGIGGPTAAATPGSQSQASGSHGTAASESGSAEKDPFLSLLEQLAENEQNSQGGPSELDFFLGASGVGGVDTTGAGPVPAAGSGGVGDPGQGIVNNDGGENGSAGGGVPPGGTGGAGTGNDEMSGVVQ